MTYDRNGLTSSEGGVKHSICDRICEEKRESMDYTDVEEIGHLSKNMSG